MSYDDLTDAEFEEKWAAAQKESKSTVARIIEQVSDRTLYPELSDQERENLINGLKRDFPHLTNNYEGTEHGGVLPDGYQNPLGDQMGHTPPRAHEPPQ